MQASRVARLVGRRLAWKENALRYLSCTRITCDKTSPSAEDTAQTAPIRMTAHQLAKHPKLAPEKYSLSRGLALNRFEKDFLIFPEYADAESAANIQSFTAQLKGELSEALKALKASDETLPDPVLAVIRKSELSSAYVPSEYGGLGMCNKDLLSVCEVLGLDLNVYMSMNQVERAVKLISMFASPEQKQKLLPAIAAGSLRPAICLFDDNGNFDFDSMRTTSTAMGDGSEKINGSKGSVVGVKDANLFLVFARRTSALQQNGGMVCYVIEKDSLPQGAITVKSRLHTLGLNALHVSDVELRDVSVTSANVLGSPMEGRDMALEVCASNSCTYGAAVVGFLKSLTEDLVRFCNTTVQYNTSLSDNRGIQRVLTELCLSTFVLESVSYYVGGLVDEDLVVAIDIETAVIHKLANRALRLAITTTVEVMGTGSCDKELAFERMFRDAITLMSLSNAESNLTEQISMGTLTTWANTNARSISGFRSGKTGALRRLLGVERDSAEMSDPKLTHFIAEHAHPSLENACRDLEQTMSRLNMVIAKLTNEQGKRLETDFTALCGLSTVVENNLGMVAVISRASRSYSIGLRNADLELAWALTYCSRTARDSLTELNSLIDYFGLVRFSPSMLQIGRAALDMGGYCLESPLEKNW